MSEDTKYLNTLTAAIDTITSQRAVKTGVFGREEAKSAENISRDLLSETQRNQFPKDRYEAVVNWPMAVDRIYQVEKKTLRNSRNPNRPLVRFSQGTRVRVFVDIYQAPKSRITGRAEYYCIPRNAEFLYKKKQWLIKSGWTNRELIILRYLMDKAIEWMNNREAQENHTAGMYGREFTTALYESVDGPCWAFMKPEITARDERPPLSGEEFAKLSKEERELFSEYVAGLAKEAVTEHEGDK